MLKILLAVSHYLGTLSEFLALRDGFLDGGKRVDPVITDDELVELGLLGVAEVFELVDY
jgi:hypothetical protein